MEKLEACCVKHNKIFSIVCLDDQCENRGVLCSECLNFHIGHTMISLEKYEKEGEIKRENRKPVAYKVHKEHVKFLLYEINKNKTITMTELKHKLQIHLLYQKRE